MIHELLNRAELAALLHRSPGYVSAMRRAGFTQHLPGRYLYQDAIAWLREHPEFKTTDAYTCKRCKKATKQHRATPRNK